MGITVVKRNGEREPYDANKINLAIENAAQGLDENITWVTQIASELELTLFDGITTQQLDEAVIQVALQNVKDDPAFDTVAARLLLKTIYKRVLGDYETHDELVELHTSRFRSYVERGVAETLLDGRFTTALRPRPAGRLPRPVARRAAQVHRRRHPQQPLRHQGPQRRRRSRCRSSSGCASRWASRSTRPTPPATPSRSTTRCRSSSTSPPAPRWSTRAPPTRQLSNCFVMEMQDDIEHIAKSVRDVMWLTKGTGGIGLSVTKLRAQGSPIRSNNTTSTGPIPFMHTIDSMLRAVSRGGKKFGALCFYMENWHLDFPEFLDLRQNSGDPYRRTRTANTAVWISDEFMKRVQNDEDWYLFDPLEVSDLNELYGKAFSERYAEYVAEAEAGKMRMFKKISAREQFKRHPDEPPDHQPPVADLEGHDQQPCAQQQHGHDPPLQPVHRDHAAAGPRQRLRLQPRLDQPVAPPGRRQDWTTSGSRRAPASPCASSTTSSTSRVSSVDEADFSNQQNRAIGLGVMGFTDIVEKLGLSYESEEAYDLIDEIMEHVSYAAIDESADLAQERGAYPNFEGSRWSQGLVPIDSIALHRGRPRRRRSRSTARPGSTGTRLREQGQGRHAQRDADGDRADRVHRPRRRHHARPRPAVLADLQPGHLVGQVPRGQPQPGRGPAGARPLGGRRARSDPAASQGDIQKIDEIPDEHQGDRTRRASSCRRTRSSRSRLARRSGSTRRSAATCTSRRATSAT